MNIRANGASGRSIEQGAFRRPPRGGCRAATLRILVPLLLGAAPVALAQTETPEDRLVRLLDNRDQLNITLQLAELDQAVPPAPVANPKTTWMSGRPVQVIVYITNPTAAALEIPDPFDPRADGPEVCFQVGLFTDGTINWRCGSDDNPAAGAQLDVPSRFINPSDTLVVVHKTTELIPGAEEFWLGEAGLPRPEGHYSLGYLGALFEFDILAPVPVSSVLVALHAQRTYIDTVQGTGVVDNLNMILLSVSDNGWPTICWSIGDVESAIDLTPGPQGRLDPAALNTVMPIGVYALPAVSGAAPGPIATLTASADTSDRITIDYAGSDGVHHLLALNAARRLPQPNEETISTPSAVGGPASGGVGGAYQYTAGGATSSLGHPIQYLFDWGDGTSSDWLDPSTSVASQTWSNAAFYPVVVQARCANDRTAVSSMSPALTVTIGSGSPPSLATISAGNGLQGTVVTVTLTGANFLPGATVGSSNAAITVGSIVVVNASQMTAILTIGSTAAPGIANITVTTNGGTSAPLPFRVDPTAPTVSALTPASGIQGATVLVTITGTNFVPGATVAANSNGIAVGAVTVVSSTQITTTLTIGLNTTLGATSLTVTTTGGTSGPLAFTVNAPPPVLSSVSPTNGAQGTSVAVTLPGANFLTGSTVAVSNTGVIVSNVSVVNSTQINATFTIAASATLGASNVTVTTIGGTSNAVTFTMTGETISTPAVPAGPTSGVSGTLYQYTASGASSSLGHVIQYSFDWGDGSHSGWTPNGVTSSFHTWNAPGTYIVTVQARCTIHNSVLSAVSAGLTVTIAGESVSTPSTPNGPATAVTGTAVTNSTGGATSSLGHTVQYRFFWGDGSNSPWLAAGTTSASQIWQGPGTYSVTVQARCTVDTQVISQTSTALTVTVSAGETISTPTTPAGPSSGAVGNGYTYSTGGASSSLGNNVRYLFDWGDGTTSGWLAAGVTSASHQWAGAGNYTVKAFAASSASLLIQSSPSAGLAVSIQ